MTERLQVGERLSFAARGVDPQQGFIPYEVAGTITGRHKGGFYGEVFELADDTRGETIIKTGNASGLIHKAGRFINWGGMPFPAQVNENAAFVDYVSQKIARGFLPAATNVYVPDAHGVGYVPRYGFVQDIEKLYGRPPHYLEGMREYNLIMDARRAISALGFELGNANWAGQTHPDNVFGLQNLWINAKGGVTLVDQLPGIRHKGSFLGIRLPFLAFQQEMRDRLGAGKIVFNEIDTDLHRRALNTDPRFTSVDKKSLHGFLDVYDDLRVSLEQELKGDRFEKNVAALVTLGIIKKYPQGVAEWGDALFSTVAHGGKIFVAETKEGLKEHFLVRLIAEEGFAKLFFTGLSLLEDGYRHGALSKDEWLKAKSLAFGENEQLTPLQRKKIRNYVSLWGAYLASSMAFNTLGVAGVLAVEVAYPGEHRLAGIVGFTLASLLPAALRYASTGPFSRITKQNTDILRTLAPIPFLGSVVAVPAQMAANPELTEAMTNYWPLTVRGIAAKLSSVAPWGGSGSDLEARIMQMLFRKQKMLQKRFRLPAFFTPQESPEG